MKDTLEKLLQITEGCREDMHEPDEQGLSAKVRGHHLDNAFPANKVSRELRVDLTKGHGNKFVTERFNLATLIALARKADLTANKLAALWEIADHIPENWGDECKDGYVRLNISADAIHAVEEAINQPKFDKDKERFSTETPSPTLKDKGFNSVPPKTRNEGLLDALEGLLAHLWDGRKRDVKQNYSLMVAEVAANEAIRQMQSIPKEEN